MISGCHGYEFAAAIAARDPLLHPGEETECALGALGLLFSPPARGRDRVGVC
jgi:hypothetical protein